MAKQKRNSANFAQTFQPRPLVKTRAAPPIPFETKTGISLLCPFCADHHPLMPDQESPCGTRVEVSAVQEVISVKLVRKENLICIKCHKSGGEMIKYRNSFVHLVDCAPEVRLLQTMPRFSKFAAFVFGLPEGLRKNIEKFTGRADQVQDIDNEGNKTGKVLGHFFQKGSLNGKPRSA